MSAPRRLSPEPVVCVAGATGLVGRTLLEILEARRFPAAEVRLLASAGSAGERIPFRGEELAVGEVREQALEGCDLVFFAATGALSRELAPAAMRRGAIVIDKSATWRLDPGVPLVVPEVNARRLADHEGLIACPNCTTIGLVMALEPLRRAAGLERVLVTTLQAASGAGRAGLTQLALEEERGGREAAAGVFPARLARNVVAQCAELASDGETTEEKKLRAETRRILELPELALEATCVRVPVAVGHAASVFVQTVRALELVQAREALASFPGLRLVDGTPPTPADVAGTDEVLVGRVREAEDGSGLWLWQVADNLRKGAATNAVQIAEWLLER